MRKIASLAFLSLVLVLSVYTVTLASAQEVPPGQICQGVPAPISQGSCAACVAHLQNGPATLHDLAICICKAEKDLGGLDAAGLNLGQCLQLFK